MKNFAVAYVFAFAVASYVTVRGVEISDAAAVGAEPTKATVTATVSGVGDVYVEYAHAKATYPSVKDRYVTDGLIAMWDGEDNQGTGVHDPSATTWVDLAGNHAAMQFTNAAPVIGANHLHFNGGGGFITDAADIGAALNAEACTVEIVCNPVALVNDGTLFACVDYANGVKHRTAWVRSGTGVVPGVIASMEYKAGDTSYEPYQQYDMSVNEIRSYTFTYSADKCRVYRNGAAEVVADGVNKGVNCEPSTAWFSVGQRTSKNGQSTGKANMKVYAIRIYSRVLTADEIAANHAQDVARFFAPAVDLDNPAGATVSTAFLGTVRSAVANAKDFYATNGLIAMWDGEDNQGTGVHEPSATTWVDLVGNHAAMHFTNAAPAIGANYLHFNGGGGFITDAADIAAALNAEAATVEYVCDVASLVDDGTLFACVDGSAKRIAWVRSGDGTGNAKVLGAVGSMEYKATASSSPYQNYDTATGKVRGYTFTYSSDKCRVYKDGSADVATSTTNRAESGDAATAWFSVAQRTSKSAQSVAKSNVKIYAIRIYNRVLTAEEIAANHAADVVRFWGGSDTGSLGATPVVLADGSMTLVTNGVAAFPLSGLRADVADYTARLFTPGGTPGASFGFSTGSEREASAWFEYLDSRNTLANRSDGPAIYLNYAANGQIPAVEAHYQILGSGEQAVFGAIEENPNRGTYVMNILQNGVLKLRYRVDNNGAYREFAGDVLAGVQELTLNGPNGTYLNGTELDASLAGETDSGTLGWLLFARNIRLTDSSTYFEYARTRVWYFRLFSNGTLVRDMVPARRCGMAPIMFDRAGNKFYVNCGGREFVAGPMRPAPRMTDAELAGSTFTSALTREGTAASDIYVAYGSDYGDAEPSAWEHFVQLDVSFAAGATAQAVSVRGIDRAAVKYVRFFSYEDGWSDTAYVPDLKVRNGTLIIFQ